jgi:hypothetical protein
MPFSPFPARAVEERGENRATQKARTALSRHGAAVPHHVRKVAWSVNHRPSEERQGELVAIGPARLVQG